MTDDHTAIPTLFQHSRRPQWGLAIMAWEGRDRRRYQFQDGRLRTFKRGFYQLFKPVDRPLDEAMEIAHDLRSKLDIARARREVIADARERGVKLTTFEDQLTVFRDAFPGGFEDETYNQGIRGRGARRVLKGHRDPAVAKAKEKLGAEQLAALIDAGDFAGVQVAALAVLSATNLVPPRDRSAIKRLDGAQLAAFSEALRDLLYDTEGAAVPAHMDRLIKALKTTGERITWPLVTALPALASPEDHVCVRPSVFRVQTKWMAPTLDINSDPSGATYERVRAMAFLVRRRLEQSGLPVDDLLDVYEFVWATLRPAARKRLEELRAQAS